MRRRELEGRTLQQTVEEGLLTPSQVAARLRISRDTVYLMTKRGDLRALRLGHGPKAHMRIPDTELDRLLTLTASDRS